MTNFIIFNNCHIGNLKNAEELGIWLVGPELYQGVDKYHNTFFITVDTNDEIIKSVIGKDEKSLHYLVYLLITHFGAKILHVDDFLLHCKYYDKYADYNLGYLKIEEQVILTTDNYRSKLKGHIWREYYGLTIQKSKGEINPELDSEIFLDDVSDPYGIDYYESEEIKPL